METPPEPSVKQMIEFVADELRMSGCQELYNLDTVQRRRMFEAIAARLSAAPPAPQEPTEGIRGECWYCFKPGFVYRNEGGYNVSMCDACRDAGSPLPSSPSDATK